MLRRSVAIVTCLACAAALLAGSRAAGEVGHQPLRVLQLNLCDSGIAGCYTGQSVSEAAAVIRAHAPDLVTLNEACENGMEALGEAMMEVHDEDTVVWAFEAARDRRTGDPYRCLNGYQFGNGLLARIPAPYLGHTIDGGIFPAQDRDDPEERAWLCVHATGAYSACTTHLAYTSATVALAQCRYLLDTAVPALHANQGYEPTVLAGDLNLRYGGTPDLRSCLPAGYRRVDDGNVQQVVATADFTVRSRWTIDMDGTTDHPGLLVALTTG